MKKKFCIYCSGNASRVIKFYSEHRNMELFEPECILYDGENPYALNQLKILFKNKLIHLEFDKLMEIEKSKINLLTTNWIMKMMESSNSDYLLCFGKRIIKKPLLDKYPNRLINFHPSILPAYKGLAAIDQALKNKSSLLGNTAHYINEQMDDGEIIIQTVMLACEFQDYEDVLELQFPMIKIILRDILNYRFEDNLLFAELRNRKKKYLIPEWI